MNKPLCLYQLLSLGLTLIQQQATGLPTSGVWSMSSLFCVNYVSCAFENLVRKTLSSFSFQLEENGTLRCLNTNPRSSLLCLFFIIFIFYYYCSLYLPPSLPPPALFLSSFLPTPRQKSHYSALVSLELTIKTSVFQTKRDSCLPLLPELCDQRHGPVDPVLYSSILK